MKFSMFSASFEARSLLASFYIVSRIFEFVKNFFNFFEAFFLSVSLWAFASFSLLFRPCVSLWQLDYLIKYTPSCQRFFLSFFEFFCCFFRTPVYMRFPPCLMRDFIPLAASILRFNECFVIFCSQHRIIDFSCSYIQNEVLKFLLCSIAIHSSLMPAISCFAMKSPLNQRSGTAIHPYFLDLQPKDENSPWISHFFILSAAHRILSAAAHQRCPPSAPPLCLPHRLIQPTTPPCTPKTWKKENPRVLFLKFIFGLSWKINYSIISVTTPDPTVLPPSLIANLSPSSIAIGVIREIVIVMLSPGMHISVPSGNCRSPVTSVVLK